MALITINRRLKFFNRIEDVRNLRPGHYVVETSFGVFHVEGGRPAGGSPRDWFIDPACPQACRIFKGTIPATSLVDALKTLDNA